MYGLNIQEDAIKQSSKKVKLVQVCLNLSCEESQSSSQLTPAMLFPALYITLL